ncbi:hypothetical protein K3495_g2194 [Podosphaera aphanis]|nr:hypothetical protein K3495_g2194 [Podosphaera aphanis]
MKNLPEDKKPLKMVRSSIACARCRRSKVKCVNNGPSSTCKSCAQSNRECTYPVAGSSPSAKRSEVPTGIPNAAETGESKKRNRKLEDAGRKISHRGKEDPLDSPVLTRKVWDEIFELFKLHFSTEMPFLHPPTFRNRMRQAAFPRDASTPPADLEEGRVLLLGVLTLTARFHPGLVAHHSPNGVDPSVASEFYALPLAAAFGSSMRHLSQPSLENIQALLMLGLYEWSQTRGLSAWLNVGLAIRLAFSMGLSHIDGFDNHFQHDTHSPIPSTYSQDSAIKKEVRRRTMWSCFIMDRMLSAGRNRPLMIVVDKLAVHLPCSDDQFLFVHNISTNSMSPKWMTLGELGTAPNDDGVLSLYLRLIEIFGNLSEWSFSGGRKNETLPPWNEASGFNILRRRLKNFSNALPPSLTFTEANLSAHIEKRNATTYAALHTLYSLCLIVLHREYVPFVPLRCEKPMGPFDAPKSSSEECEMPHGFWEESTKCIMKAARNIIDIFRTCQDSNALPESPLIGFAIWQAVFFCVYTLWFPQMDPENYLVDNSCLESGRRNKSASLLSVVEKLLSEMGSTLHMVKEYFDCIEKMHRYFFTVYRDYCFKYRRGEVNDQYKHYERGLRGCGEISEHDHPCSEASEEPNRSRASTNDAGANSSSGEQMQGIEAASQRQNGSWAPINASSSVDEERTKYMSHGPNSYRTPYTHPQNHPSPVPSYIVSSLMTSTGVTNNNLTDGLTPNCGPWQSHAKSNSAATVYNTGLPTENAGSGTETNEQNYSTWIQYQEEISMNTGLDNFVQEAPMEQYLRSRFSYTAPHPPNFLQAIWMPSNRINWASPAFSGVEVKQEGY